MNFTSAANEYGRENNIHRASPLSAVVGLFCYYWYTLGKRGIESKVDALFVRIQTASFVADTLRFTPKTVLRGVATKKGGEAESLSIFMHAYCRARSQGTKEAIRAGGDCLLARHNQILREQGRVHFRPDVSVIGETPHQGEAATREHPGNPHLRLLKCARRAPSPTKRPPLKK